MSNVIISESLRDLLHSNLLEERDLVESIGLSEIEPIPDESGRYVCLCLVPVRRPFDPETAELRRLELKLRKVDSGGWEVESIAGLTEPDPGPEP